MNDRRAPARIAPAGRADHILARVPAAVGFEEVFEVREVVGEVEAGAEGTSGAAQDDDPHRAVAIGGDDGVLDLIGHRRHDGVQPLRPVESDGSDGAVGLVEERFVRHGISGRSPKIFL